MNVRRCDGKECRESDDGGSELHGEDEDEDVIRECGLAEELVMRMLASSGSFYISRTLREPVQEPPNKTLNKLDKSKESMR